ncbi:hypothetical protein CDD80_5475 [Ophiocordyceps camponoti-rufipedis]|uniref:MICOS complex subunit MIC60 n=1 Tax=Ophiocordyceps camponoti-rufipedis TaxID=2004952 RepID=A0A2C5YVW9_9HYPO|nr:hypothetical protein CDD80_5475 [Ophiocordyceps camponoti-rufipedis]
MYYRNANCAVVVYDITQSSSLDKAKAWVKELQRQANENIIIALAGNKLDLVTQQPDKRAISTNEAEAYAREAGLLFFETSAKTAENVRELFTAIAKKLPLDQVGPRHARPGQRPGVSLNPENANTNSQLLDEQSSSSKPALAKEFAMLRSSLRSARPLGSASFAAASRRQLAVAAAYRGSLRLNGNRSLSDRKTPGPGASETPVLPSSKTLTSQRVAPPDGLGEPKLGAATKLPPTPPTPEEVSGGPPRPPSTIDDVGESTLLQKEMPAAPPPPSPPPPRTKSFGRRLRNLAFGVVLLSVAGFGGGALYSRSNDNFHDFFTEYVPYGEQAVLYLEEMDYKKKFPHIQGRAASHQDSKQVKISAQSGASWRVADSGEPSGRHSNASPKVKELAGSSPKTTTTTTEKEPAKASPPESKVLEPAVKSSKVTPKIVTETVKEPEVNEPSMFTRLKSIDLMSLPDAKEPIVRDLVRMLNDLILVINADGAHARYGTTVEKAKKDVADVGARLRAMKTAVEKKAASEVKSAIGEFEKAATDLVERVEQKMAMQEQGWRQEFEEEMKAVRDKYEERVRLVTHLEQQRAEATVENQLKQQALSLKREFAREVKKQVEEERQGRLGKLEELSSTVSELEKLMTGWNEVVDSNLKTQQLHVAVEAVRARLEDGQNPRPFIRELVALKEIATDDAVVEAAIGSVNPAAYQRGIATSLQLVDRFRRVASEVRKASLLPEEAGVASHASSWALSHVLFKKQGLAAGDDVESILTRAQTHLEEGDLDSAAREMNGLQGWAKALSRDWLGEVRKVLEVRQALDIANHRPSSMTNTMTTPRLIFTRSFVTAARTYDEALSKLTALPPNKTAKALFKASASTTRKKKVHSRALQEMTAWLAHAGYQPSDLSRLRTVHVAGTKGKGTVCALVTAMLLRSGLSGPVGTYTSPHLVTPRERIAVDGSSLSRQEFADAVFELDDRIAASTSERPFFFRFMTLLAWHVFLSRQMEHVVMECGIGGEHDATNILPPEAVSATVITQLDHDHVAMLGDSLGSIAWHKAGIMKAGVRCFALRPDDLAAAEMLRARAVERHVAGEALVEVNDDVLNVWPGVDDKDTQETPFTTKVRKANQALAALAVREHLGLTRPDETPLDALSSLTPPLLQGMRECRLRGRREVLVRGETEWLLDVAHTPRSLEAVGSWAAGYWAAARGGMLILVFAVQPDRDPLELLCALHRGMREIQSGASAWFRVVIFVGDRADKSLQRAREDMAWKLQRTEYMLARFIEPTVEDALGWAEMQGELDFERPLRVLVTGSMRLVGDALRLLDPDMPS